MPKLCKDCKYISPFKFAFWARPIYRLSRCLHPAPEVNLVSGEREVGEFCSILRMELAHREVCGPEGKWWEPRA